MKVIQISAIISEKIDKKIESLLQSSPKERSSNSFSAEQGRDPEVQDIISFAWKVELPVDDGRAHRIAIQGSLFTLDNDILYYLDLKQEYH